ncbi:putative ornithine decarboxylase [Liquorilactobacillus oeni]|uniref:Ornithine decarboxylase n=1 Tax=Liquorilactobacillus oeni DSM 19972 TaxID=1423777 RepID=A0A0R1M894_9LACO|nr:putative ornithine decarboxylase [Liquorilactobacillus oeni]KRL04423.1 ornithine decarboxylase [Liquorilactobacillus oeni DSM 19972]
MNYLKIAAPQALWEYLPDNWGKTTLNKKTSAACLAAIVISRNNKDQLQQAEELRQRSGLKLPIIQISDSKTTQSIKKEIAQSADEYQNKNVPAFLLDLFDFAQKHPVSFTTPGHHNGSFYAKHPAGEVFKEFLGDNLFYADTSDTVPQLGDTMTHNGSPLTAEQLAAKAYHADKVYFCTNGTTSANTICASALLTPEDLVLFDRNNHKSLYNSALLENGAIPVYLPADRNALGLIGETDPTAFDEQKLRQEIFKKAPLKAHAKRPFRLAVLQLETYDGVFYNAAWILKKIGHLCDYILFDCAWGGYEQFSPLLSGLSPLNQQYQPTDPGILVTQSIHKQQAGMGQVSQILKKDRHLKGQPRYVDHKHFNNAYLKHVTSSYSYPLYASLTVNATMAADKTAQKQWWQELLADSIEFRKKLLKRSKLFRPWLPRSINGKKWQNITLAQLVSDPALWNFCPKDNWHGFGKVAENQVRLDPFKLTIITPGIDQQNQSYETTGIPGAVVAEFLMENGIIRGKDDLNSLLFLLTPGNGEKELTLLLQTLLKFEHLYLENASLSEVLPKLYQRQQQRYEDYTIDQLCQQMHEYYRDHQTFKLQRQLFQAPVFNNNYQMRPQQAEFAFRRNQGKLVDLKQAVGKIALEGALPYPPGVFVVAPGEKWTVEAVNYFETLLGAAAEFPGFEPEIQGVYYQLHQENFTAQVIVLN